MGVAIVEEDRRVGEGGWRVEEAGGGVAKLAGLILDPVGYPRCMGGPVGERREGRGSLCPRGPASP